MVIRRHCLFSDALRKHYPRKREIDLDRAVLFEDVVDRVIVITYCRDKADDQLARSTRFVLAADRVEVLPKNSSVAFVNADRSFERVWFAIVVGKCRVD